MIAPGVNVSGLHYVASVTEVSYSGRISSPFRQAFAGARARTRALDWAKRERRSSTLLIEVLPEGGKRRKPVWTYRNDRPICPCNDPRCSSLWAAGLIRAPLDCLASVAPQDAVRRAPWVAVPIVGCTGLGQDRCAA